MTVNRIIEDKELGPLFVRVNARARRLTFRTKEDGIYVTVPPRTSLAEIENALELQKAGAAVVIEEKNLTGDGLVKTVETLLTSPGKLAEMGANAKTLGNPHSLDLITEKLLKLVNG